MLVGLIDSDQQRRRHAASKTNESYEEWLAKLGAALPMGRYGKPEEFAATALVPVLGGRWVHRRRRAQRRWRA